MDLENLAYALVQLGHNFGAAAVVGGAVFALWPTLQANHARTLAGLVLAGWALQIATGVLFGVVSIYYYGRTPDLSAVATTALAVKVSAAVAGLLLAGWYLKRGARWDPHRLRATFRALIILGVTALAAAAFLRWFS
ncbi:conserved hypothetical protein [Thiobacillus denitrificans ATCC 25259]|uniref:Copper resistance protein D domain-containing protein n=1 Tax=Thiobacillus denitrificans (strain ATCC 25259 / T1) TaxID=292415 RepID=Q3SJ44_THIDA|nr:hypothetical protein [Thiobacillus denitrificans]AAZ97326.1 conserved hypothetical protein [Thiobacillus denitrificans ATCC 25259]